MKTKTFYKKIVTYTKVSSENFNFNVGIILLGSSFGYILGVLSEENKFALLCTLFLFGIGNIILNYYVTHHREVKYEKYEVQRK